MLTLEEQNELLVENRRMRKALELVRDWNLPLIEMSDGQMCSYESQLGSNGARDYVRTIAENTPKTVS